MADQEYLQNIAGSPHVDEGLGDRILSRGSSGLQRFRSMAGGEFSDPNYTKVQSLFNSFLKKITGILKDFAEGPHSVSNRLLQMKPKVTPQQETAIQQIKDLYSLVVPPSVLQHQVQHSVLQPRSSRSQLTEMLSEGIFTREMGLNAALYSNDPVKIISAYSKELRKAYDSFIFDSMKVTGTPKDYVKRIVGNINQKWSPIVSKVEQVSNPPLASAQPAPTQPEPTPTAPTNTPQPAVVPTAQASPTSPTQASAKSAEDDFVVLISNVIDILVDAVKGDEKLAAAFFKPSAQGGKSPYEPLPTNWAAPSVTKEEKEEKEEAPEQEGGEEPEETPSGEKHEFLYNFHSLYRKQRHFAIDVPIHDKSKSKFVNRRTKTVSDIQVVWSNNSHENNIYVKYTPVGEDKNIPAQKSKGGEILLFKFWDNQVNPRNPESNKFNVVELLSQANQNSTRLLTKANQNLVKEVSKKTEELQRALYATVSRKRMEFKPKPFQLTQDEQGNVSVVKRDGTKVPVSKETLNAKLNDKDEKVRERWKTALEKIGYKFPNQPEKDDVELDKIPAAMDAVKVLQSLQHKFTPAAKAVQMAVEKLGDKASTEEYSKYALKLLTPPSNPVSGPVTAPVSAPVTAPVSAPVTEPVSAEPTAPVSTNKPKPDVAPGKPGEKELGKATWDDNGIITWEKPDGKTVKVTSKQLKKMKIPRLEFLLKQQGYFDKFPAALKEWLGEEIVDPFDLANLL